MAKQGEHGIASRAKKHVMASDKSPWPAVFVEFWELRVATTCARNRRVGVSLFACGWIAVMPLDVLGDRRLNFKIAGSIVLLVPVGVMYNLTFPKRPSNFPFCNESVFVNVPAHIGKVMPRHPEQNIAIGCRYPAALPVRVTSARMNNSHVFRIAHYNPQYERFL